MKYRRLPVEITLANIQEKDGDKAMEDARSALFNELRGHDGFQLIIALLRDLEKTTLQAMKTAVGPVERLLGRLQCIEAIRQSLISLLPVDQRSIDWYDEEAEPLIEEI